MADQKISQLSDGGASQATDEYVIARSGANYRIDGASIAAAATSVGTLSSLTVSGDLTVDTSTLKVDSTNNRVGIGTASPGTGYRLHIVDSGNTVGTNTPLFLSSANGVATTSYGWDNLTSSYDYTIKVNGSTTALTISNTGNLAVDTNTLYVDAANNRVGVGTASPGYQFDVRGSSPDIVAFHNGANGSRVGITATNTAAYIGTTYSTNDIPLIFTRGGIGSSGSELMRLDTSGNLGLGVTPSAWGGGGKAFEVGALGNGLQGRNTQFMTLTQNAYYDALAQYIYGSNGLASRYDQDAGAHKWFTAPSGTAGNAISFTQAMTLDASGNLGVGTTSPTNYGAGYRTIAVNGTSSGVFEIRSNDTVRGLIVGDATDLQIQASGAIPMRFFTNGNERARITSGGDFLVNCSSGNGKLSVRGAGTTSATHSFEAANSAGNTRLIVSDDGLIRFYGSDNGEKARHTAGGYFKASDAGTYNDAAGAYHELRNSANEPALAAHCTNASFTSGVLVLRTTQAAGTGFNFIAAQANLVDQFVVRGDGNVINTNGSYGTISDERLKQDIVDAPSQWDDLKAVRFRKYRMKTDVAADPNAPAMLGVVAQELELVSPGLVDEHPDFEEQEVTDGDGNVTTERVQVGTTKSVKSSILLMKAAVALQEAMARIESLEARLAALES